MRIKLTILTLVLTCTLQAQDFFSTNAWKFTYYSGIAAILSVPVYSHYWDKNYTGYNGLTVSSGVDAKMTSELKLDFRQRFYYSIGRFEPEIVAERFEWAEYTGLGIGLNYKIIDCKLAFLAGLETTRIWNQGQIVQSVGCNLESRLYLTDRLSVSGIANLKTRPELINEETIGSVYFHVNYLLIKNKKYGKVPYNN